MVFLLTRRGIFSIFALTQILLVGCFANPGDLPPSTDAVSATKSNELSKEADALKNFSEQGYEIPESSTDITVRLVDYQPLRDVSLISFVAPAEDVLAMCAIARGAKRDHYSFAPEEIAVFSLGGITAEGRRTCGSWKDYGQVRVLVLLPEINSPTTWVELYRMPVR